jgi:DNA invertase Pin-like site-specific DNA recombinase
MKQALELIDTLGSQGIKVYVLNLGLLDDSPIGKLIKNILTTTAECERDMRMQRTAEGKQAAKKTSGYREGRPPKYSDEDLKSALKFLKTHTFTEVTEMTGISRSTLVRLKKKS